jgi:hypothetical protein
VVFIYMPRYGEETPRIMDDELFGESMERYPLLKFHDVIAERKQRPWRWISFGVGLITMISAIEL